MQNYKIGKRISDGAFGTVYQATNLSPSSSIPSTVAVKQMYSSQFMQRQLKILKKLPKHPHIIEVFATFTSKFQTSIVMERGKYDLATWMERNVYPVREDVIKNIAHQLLEGLNLLHANHIIHRDLKPSNLMVRENGQLAICDFGSAVECSKGEEYEIEGFTRWYKCPEMLYGCRNYLHEADIWSTGCILMELATGCPLFGGKSEIQQLSLIAKFLGDPSPANWPGVVKMPDYQKINFKPMPPKTAQEIAEEWSVSLPFVNFILKMVRYENRASTKDLLKDDYFKDMVKTESIDLAAGGITARQRDLIEQARKERLL